MQGQLNVSLTPKCLEYQQVPLNNIRIRLLKQIFQYITEKFTTTPKSPGVRLIVWLAHTKQRLLDKVIFWIILPLLQNLTRGQIPARCDFVEVIKQYI